MAMIRGLNYSDREIRPKNAVFGKGEIPFIKELDEETGKYYWINPETKKKLKVKSLKAFLDSAKKSA